MLFTLSYQRYIEAKMAIIPDSQLVLPFPAHSIAKHKHTLRMRDPNYQMQLKFRRMAKSMTASLYISLPSPVAVTTDWGTSNTQQFNSVTIQQFNNPFVIASAARQSQQFHWSTILGVALLTISIYGSLNVFAPEILLETKYYIDQTKMTVMGMINTNLHPMPNGVPMVYNPLITADGNAITPVDNEFSIIIPKIGINSKVIPAINPTDQLSYNKALLQGVAHASTSYFPDENGVVYVFSHSTNYDWYVKDLNAVFYLVKNMKNEDPIVLVYKGKRYTYKLREKRVVKPTDTSFMMPIEGKRMLILQTCWPPGSYEKRLLLFADLIDVQNL